MQGFDPKLPGLHFATQTRKRARSSLACSVFDIKAVAAGADSHEARYRSGGSAAASIQLPGHAPRRPRRIAAIGRNPSSAVGKLIATGFGARSRRPLSIEAGRVPGQGQAHIAQTTLAQLAK